MVPLESQGSGVEGVLKEVRQAGVLDQGRHDVLLCVEINQCVGCDNSSLSHFSATTLQSWLRSSGEEPSLRADKELRRENAVVVLLRYVCASDVYVRALLEDSFWSG